MQAHRWSDNDQYWGPFTFARHRPTERRLALILNSGADEYPGCHIRLTLPWFDILCALPAIVKPFRRKVYPKWDAATVARLGRDWYYDEYPREYGFSLYDNFLRVFYGTQSDDCDTKRRTWSTFLPWGEYRQIRHELIGRDGDVVWAQRRGKKGRAAVEDCIDARERCPGYHFKVEDYDGAPVTVRTFIEHRVWRRGEKWCKWLGWITRDINKTFLELEFSEGIGRRKHDWKGGTIAHSIEMEPGDTQMSAVQRYYQKHGLTFVNLVGEVY